MRHQVKKNNAKQEKNLKYPEKWFWGSCVCVLAVSVGMKKTAEMVLGNRCQHILQDKEVLDDQIGTDMEG